MIRAAAGLSPSVRRTMLTVCAMSATIMQALDSTVANVALPYMQGSLSASLDQVSWVLTSYIVAAAVMTAPVGWLSDRFGRKKLFLFCVGGFTAASCHWIRRIVLVSEPFFSAAGAIGRKNTSVLMSLALAPGAFQTPAGSAHAIDYEAEAGPTVTVRVQALYGLAQHPAVAGGRVPLVLSLTSPAGRPIQTTRDLPGFWKGSWSAVAKEMRGRYPKHPWPDDPASADPTLRTKKASARSAGG